MKPILFAAAVVFSTVTMANVPATWLPGSPEGAAQVQDLSREEADAHARSRGKAAYGVVEDIRRIEHGGERPATFEFTVRLRDGSARTSHTDSAAKWRSGDRILLIGGAPASGA
jgi:hypothetical protein